MQTWIALLRGINVGSRNKMPMTDLANTLQSAGCRSVRTYIQSGNVVFASNLRSNQSLTAKIGTAIETHFGFRPHVLLLSAADFRSAVTNNPFPNVVSEPKTLHFFFLNATPASPDLDGISELATTSERFQLIDSVFYLHAPDGFGRSKLAAATERKLGVATTARNYTTIHNLSAMLNAT
ncbi:MAG: DUF1697 domain-containing protein [Verrucomicrobiae bacterium]|jgi:uncharacterized protein (DUF1697 family)|nr:DUF1697 domain-containing protein [Verrucomicrobiae bacterium]